MENSKPSSPYLWSISQWITGTLEKWILKISTRTVKVLWKVHLVKIQKKPLTYILEEIGT